MAAGEGNRSEEISFNLERILLYSATSPLAGSMAAAAAPTECGRRVSEAKGIMDGWYADFQWT